MKVQLVMSLTRQAKNKGGDRYECDHQGEKLVVYFPQSISRQRNEVASTLTISISDEE